MFVFCCIAEHFLQLAHKGLVGCGGSELAFLCVHEVAIAEEGGKPPLLSTRGGFFFFNLSSDTAAWSLEVSCLAKIGFLGHFYRDQRFRVVGPQ